MATKLDPPNREDRRAEKLLVKIGKQKTAAKKLREDFSQGAARIVREAIKDQSSKGK